LSKSSSAKGAKKKDLETAKQSLAKAKEMLATKGKTETKAAKGTESPKPKADLPAAGAVSREGRSGRDTVVIADGAAYMELKIGLEKLVAALDMERERLDDIAGRVEKLGAEGARSDSSALLERFKTESEKYHQALKKDFDFLGEQVKSLAARLESTALGAEKDAKAQGGLADRLKRLEEQADKLGTEIERGFKEARKASEIAGVSARDTAEIKGGVSDLHNSLAELVAARSGLEKKLESMLSRLDQVEAANAQLKDSHKKVADGNKETLARINKVLEDAEGIETRCRESSEQLEVLEESLGEASELFESLSVQLREGSLQSEVNTEKINLAFKLVEDLEVKVKEIAGPVEDIILSRRMFEEVPESSELGFELNDLLQVMIKHQASDLHLKVGSPPTVRLDGELIPVGNQPMTEADTRRLILGAMTGEQRRMLMRKRELDFAYAIPTARFRVNAFLQSSTISAAFRMLRMQMPSFEDLGLPPIVKRLCSYNHGLILVTGPAGSGKSTSLAAMIEYINSNRKMHIISIEDPIEFVHSDKLSIVTQREIGTDTMSFSDGVRNALRQDPNVLFIGEMRDPETIMQAVIAAETGHLVLSTLHTPNTVQAIDRIIDIFAGPQQRQFRLLLANTLRGIVGQRLIARSDESGRVLAVEIMMATPTITSLILDGKTNEIYQYMVQGAHEGMMTFTASLTRLFEAGLISKDEALYHSDQPTEFRLGIEGHTTGAASIPEDSLMSWL